MPRGTAIPPRRSVTAVTRGTFDGYGIFSTQMLNLATNTRTVYVRGGTKDACVKGPLSSRPPTRPDARKQRAVPRSVMGAHAPR